MEPIRYGMIGGGQGAFIGGVHRTAAAIAGNWQLVAGAFSSTPEKAKASGREIGVPDDRKPMLSGQRVLLVDDVFTTGATVSAVTKVLKRAGAREVDVLTFAMALPGDFLPEDADTI